MWSPAVAERCRWILAPDDEFERHFLDALAAHVGDDPFGRARTRLAFGEPSRLRWNLFFAGPASSLA